MCHYVCVSTEIIHTDSSVMQIDHFYNLIYQFCSADGKECIVSHSIAAVQDINGANLFSITGSVIGFN
jgi:hypothetical protein